MMRPSHNPSRTRKPTIPAATGMIAVMESVLPGRPAAPVRQASAGPHDDGPGGEVEDFDLDLVLRAAVVAVNDADAVGHHQSAFERRTAAREDAEEMSSGYGDDEPGRHERHFTGRDRHLDA